MNYNRLTQYFNQILHSKMTILHKGKTLFSTVVILFLAIPNLQAQTSDIPAPEEVLGFKVGADFHLATYEQSLAYFKKLDESSDLLELKFVGETSEGRPWYFALISSKENLQNIDHYKDIAQQLAHPGDLTREEAKQLSKEG